MHALSYVLTPTNAHYETVEEETILNELRQAEYVTELPVQDAHFDMLTQQLIVMFGKENLEVERSTKSITISKVGIIRYFNELRARINNAITLTMAKPIEEFIYLRGESDWYAIKNMIDDSFDTQFYMEGYGCGSKTVFAHNLFVQMGYQMTDTLTLEFTQVFDCHY